jgi:hypothetical protein
MATKPTPLDVNRPVLPGVSWTDPAKSRPWQQPPRYVKLTDVAQMYMESLMSEDAGNDLLDSLETGIPLSVIAETLMLTGVYKGMHTVDMGVLVMPIIMETLKSVAVFNNIDTKMYASDYDKEEKVSPRVIKQAVANVFGKAPVMEEEPVMPEAEPPMGGLMGRKNKEVV